MIEIINGDLLKTDADIIAHQVNNKGVMGSGVAKQIRAKYPEAYLLYRRFFGYGAMGNCQIVKTYDGKEVANLFGQDTYGRTGMHTNYAALRKAMLQLAQYAKENNKTVAMPYGIGCGLGGGSQEVVYRIIEESFGEYGVKLYKFK